MAGESGDDSLGVGQLFPDLGQIRQISTRIAATVCRVAFDEGIAGIDPVGDMSDEALQEFIRRRMFHPHYVPYEPA